MPQFRFTMRAVPRDPSGYYHPRWDRAQNIIVLASDRVQAASKASKALSGNGRGWPWEFQFDLIEEVEQPQGGEDE